MDKIKKYLPLGAAACAALALILGLALPALKSYGETMSGWETVFPAEIMAIITTMPFLTLVLLIVGGILSAYVYLKPSKPTLIYVAAGCLALAGIFFFCWKPFYCNAAGQEYAKEMMEIIDLGIGCILAGILSLLAGGATAIYAYLSTKSNE